MASFPPVRAGWVSILLYQRPRSEYSSRKRETSAPGKGQGTEGRLHAGRGPASGHPRDRRGCDALSSNQHRGPMYSIPQFRTLFNLPEKVLRARDSRIRPGRSGTAGLLLRPADSSAHEYSTAKCIAAAAFRCFSPCPRTAENARDRRALADCFPSSDLQEDRAQRDSHMPPSAAVFDQPALPGGGSKLRQLFPALTKYPRWIILVLLTEGYRSGHNGADSKSVCSAKGTWVRIPPSPPSDPPET